MVQEYGKKPFEEIVKENENVLVQYYADWCGPCQMLKPVLEDLSNEMTDVTFYRVNIEDHRDLAVNASVHSIPTVVFYNDGAEKAREVGFKPKHVLEGWLNSQK